MVAVSSIDVVLFYFFKFIVSFKFNFVITRMIGASWHAKNIVDGINACNKGYLIDKCRW